jgi:hypothetical protein
MRWRWRLGSGRAMIQRNRADLDLRDGGMFVEDIEKTGIRDFGSCEQRESSVLQGRKRLREKECGSQDQRIAFGLILNEIWKSKMEIPNNHAVPTDRVSAEVPLSGELIRQEAPARQTVCDSA